jgi:hypothetical protein
LTLQEQSTKRSADLLLVQKRLYHQVLEMQIRCLPNTWENLFGPTSTIASTLKH